MSLTISPNIMQSLVYSNGMFLTSSNMTTEQAYFNNWIYLQNQCAFTPGVFQGGMQVTLSGNSLVVSSGVAIDSAGHLLVVSSSGLPVTMPGTLSDPFFVYAQYPAVGTPLATGSPVLSYTAQVAAGSMVPSGAVPLATGVANGNTIVSVTNTSVPVNLQPGLLGSSLQSISGMLKGSVSVDTSSITAPGMTATATVVFPGSGTPFSTAPLVTATVQGSVPYAVAVAVETTQFVLTLASVQAGTNASVVVNWTAIANS